MTLTVHNQLTLLYDLLDEQTHDYSASIEEYQQIKKLVQKMVARNKINDEQLKQILPEIYNYGRIGEIAQSLAEHIYNNEENIETWKNTILATKLK